MRYLDQFAHRIVEHDPARIGIFFDALRQIDMKCAQVSNNSIKIIDGKREDRETDWD